MISGPQTQTAQLSSRKKDSCTGDKELPELPNRD